MKTKLFSLFVAWIATMSVFAYDFQYGDLCYDITSDSTVEVVYGGATHKRLTSAIIPESVVYNGKTYSVTSIGEYAFYDCSGLTSISIPNSITSIGEYAFKNCGLTLVIWNAKNCADFIRPSSFYAPPFYDAIGSQITSFVFGDGVEHIPAYLCFGMSNLTSIVIPNSVTSIGESVFEDCSGLTSITIPNSVTSIGVRAFMGCSGLTSITIPNSVTSIEEYVFYDCSGLTSITIPNSVTSIGERAFQKCSGLTSITIPNGVTSIGYDAFLGCSGLTSITIPNSVTSIGYDAFCYCIGLTSIAVENGNTKYDSRNNCNAIIETATNTLIAGCKNTIIPNSVTSIGYDAFCYCSDLTSITIPNSVTNIGPAAFVGCSGLTSITIPNSVTNIDDAAFCYCIGLTSITVENGNTKYDSRNNCNAIIETATNILIVGCKNSTIPNGVTSIGEFAFYDCSDLISITIPNSVTNIGFAAFGGCSGLTSITIPNSVTSIGDLAFEFCSELQKIIVLSTTPPAIVAETFVGVNRAIPVYVPAESVADYKGDIYWKEFNIQANTTPIDYTQANENASATPHKVVRNGQVLILRGGKTYTATGVEVR